MLLKALRLRARNYLTRDLVHDVFNSGLDTPPLKHVAWERMDDPFPTWRTLVSYTHVQIKKPGIYLDRSSILRYQPYTEMKGSGSFLVRPYTSCIIVVSSQKQKQMLLKDRMGNLCYIEGMTIPNVRGESGVRLSTSQFLGIAESGMIRVTYFDIAEQTVTPITDYLVDR